MFSFEIESQGIKNYDSKNDTNIISTDEGLLLAGLSSRNQKVRDSCSRGIREILIKKINIIKPGNIIEHERSYWEDKKGELELECNMEKIKSIFDIENKEGTFLSGGGRSSYGFELDNTFILSFSLLHKQSEKSSEYCFKGIRIQESCKRIILEPDSLYNGTWRIYYVNGNLWNESNYINGKKEGFSNNYYSTGELMMSTYYVEHKLMETLRYKKKGILQSRTRLINDGRYKEINTYDDKGQLVSTEIDKIRVWAKKIYKKRK